MILRNSSLSLFIALSDLKRELPHHQQHHQLQLRADARKRDLDARPLPPPRLSRALSLAMTLAVTVFFGSQTGAAESIAQVRAACAAKHTLRHSIA